MIRHCSAALVLCFLWLTPAQAQLFPRGADALRYGAYTGGHGYSYPTAYGYGLSFSAADSWRRDPFAYPAGIYPYRPYGLPITYRVFPNPPTPYISVPGPDGLPILIRPDSVPQQIIDPRVPPLRPLPETVVPASAGLGLRPVPTATGGKSAQIHIVAPVGAVIWVEKEKLSASTTGTLFQTPPLTPGKTQFYSVRAKWIEAGREIEQFRVVAVQAGDSTMLNFIRR